ncbi:MAG: HEAT repeat domain-containing protein [Planctomycetota bacterium]
MRSNHKPFIVLLLLFACSAVMAAGPAEEARKIAPKIKDYFFKHQIIRIGLPAVEPLFEQLTEPKNETISFETRSALRWIARDAKDKTALLDLLKNQTKPDRPAPVRCLAVELIGVVGGAEAVGIIAPLLADAAVCDAACAALTQVPGEAATKALADAYDKAQPEFRCSILHALGVRRDPLAREIVRRAINDGDENVSLAAISALGMMGGWPDATALENLVKTGSTKQKAAAFDEMLAIGERSLTSGKAEDAFRIFGVAMTLAPDNALRARAIAGLGRTGNPEVAPILDNFTRSGVTVEPVVKSAAQNAYVDLADSLWDKGQKDAAAKLYLKALDMASGEAAQVRALIGAGRAGSPDSIPKIEALLQKGSPKVQSAAASAIKLIPGKAATQAMTKALPAAPPSVQAVLLTALGERADAEVVQVMAPLTMSQNEETAVAAVEALGRTGIPAAQTPLLTAAEKGSDRVKAEAVQALLRLAQSLLDKDAAADAGKVCSRLLDLATDEAVRVQVFAGMRKAASAELGEKIAGLIEGEKGAAREEAVKALLACADRAFDSDKKDASKAMYQKVLQVSPPCSRQAAEAGYRLSRLGETFATDAKDGIVSQWWIIGAWRARDHGEWKREHGAEKDWKKAKKIDLTKEYPQGKRTLRWMPVRTDDKKGAFDMNRLFVSNDECVAYCYAEITVGQEQDVNLEIHSDDGHRLFVNGEPAHEYLKDHKRTEKDDRGAIHLKTGANHLLLKSCESSGEWMFSLRLTGKDGRAAAFRIQ